MEKYTNTLFLSNIVSILRLFFGGMGSSKCGVFCVGAKLKCSNDRREVERRELSLTSLFCKKRISKKGKSGSTRTHTHTQVK